jgi:hypothetical protein
MRNMTQASPPRVRLIAPLVHLTALLLLLEQWLWGQGARAADRVAHWPSFKAMEMRVSLLPPYPALCVFVLPGFLLLPLKVLALVAIAHGYPVSGVAVFVVAKLGGAVAIGHLYRLTLPSLLSLVWFAHLHERFVALKDYWIGLLRDSHLFRRAGRLVTKTVRVTRRLLRHARPTLALGSLHPSRPARLLRRFASMWRARHQ